ncbi:MAG: TetR/AcrR family transcriptional regulator [Saccharothrix sp.]|nr:TetR/AcrR family transcriptional regulator [Saccharothrix sp.]
MTSNSTDETRATRNTERTRAAVLGAAAAAMAERGTGVSLSFIARSAGVSKSGLLHHFPNRDALLTALVEDANRKFRAAVVAHLDLSENTPGKMLRAYVRALCSGSEAITQYFTSAPAWAGIYTVPGVVDLIRADERWWSEQFALDGVDDARILVVRRAAEGVAAAITYGDSDSEATRGARELLLALAGGAQLPG